MVSLAVQLNNNSLSSTSLYSLKKTHQLLIKKEGSGQAGLLFCVTAKDGLKQSSRTEKKRILWSEWCGAEGWAPAITPNNEQLNPAQDNLIPSNFF